MTSATDETCSTGKRKTAALALELEDATARMQRAIDARTPYCAFPLSLRLAVAAGRLLPAAVWDRLAQRVSP